MLPKILRGNVHQQFKRCGINKTFGVEPFLELPELLPTVECFC